MSELKVVVPAMGEGITDVTITRWLVSEGDKVENEQALVEISTDKVDSEIFATAPGVISKITRKENEVVLIGEMVAIMEINPDYVHIEEIITPVYQPQTKNDNQTEDENEVKTITIKKHSYISPFLRTLANDYNIEIEELYSIRGSGKDQMITLQDVKDYILKKQSIKNNISSRSKEILKPLDKGSSSILIKDTLFENSEIIEMDRMRKVIAEHMVRSKSISPHVTSFIEADVTGLVSWRNNNKDKFLQEVGEKLTYTPIFIEAVVKALKTYPMVNASVDENKIYLKKNINIGVATALTNGNLIVPVIRDSDKKSLVGLAREVNDIVRRARQNKLTPSEIKGGTFTITNLGTFESLSGTPIINQPEVAILAIGAINRKPAVVKVDDTETIGIRDIVVLSLAYDHRIIDGSLGGMFLKYIKDTLQNFDINRTLFT